MTEIEKIEEIIGKYYSSTARNKPPQTQQPIMPTESIENKKENEFNSIFKNTHSKISLELLRKLNQEIRKNYPLESAAVGLKPVLGTTDIKAIQNSTQSISNYIIYSNSSSSQETIEALVEIILPADLVKNKKIIHPRFTLHQANWHLNQLLDLATPKLVFSSLLSLATTISPSQILRKEQSQTQTEISQIL
ncbi:hypothetical protein Pst134EA_005507 [Puccinia striiformis f. sp. tritici]|uniref:hypothetical protein n=1 Tax=Puccinia striiformis f. sp. tritici TaxID=168172 RepID=UPI0020080707|nr:hypothetical protein Pst134EA_005507 [Puccinia striiformis f. sp. tritici]KAH9471620.1 hypothetical protein Pst134EA_005507 [Puccinia striiformis f. sp. tritici]